MNLLEVAILAVSCLVLSPALDECVVQHAAPPAAPNYRTPKLTGESLDVILTAESALAWDESTGEILYQKNAVQRRSVASLSKLASVVTAYTLLSPEEVIEIPVEAATAARRGANIRLPIGEHATVSSLTAASLIPSANDAAVALAVAVSGSEDAFVDMVNAQLPSLGVHNTRLANATGLPGGEQYSTAEDIRKLLTQAYRDPVLRDYLAAERGVLTTQEGSSRAYLTTNRLLGTYLPVLAAKTGYTIEAKQNLAMITQLPGGQEIGAVILGSDQRFQDMKVLVEWINRNYTWQ